MKKVLLVGRILDTRELGAWFHEKGYSHLDCVSYTVAPHFAACGVPFDYPKALRAVQSVWEHIGDHAEPVDKFASNLVDKGASVFVTGALLDSQITVFKEKGYILIWVKTNQSSLEDRGPFEPDFTYTLHQTSLEELAEFLDEVPESGEL